jgi:hypothetical protein
MRIAAAVVIAMAAHASAWAEAPAKPAAAPAPSAQWDDSHMQSRHRETPRTERPRLTGESGYGALVSGNATRSAPAVQELEFTSQREWEKGALSTGSNAKAQAAASAATSSQSTGISRGSAIRAGATSGRRRR